MMTTWIRLDSKKITGQDNSSVARSDLEEKRSGLLKRFPTKRGCCKEFVSQVMAYESVLDHQGACSFVRPDMISELSLFHVQQQVPHSSIGLLTTGQYLAGRKDKTIVASVSQLRRKSVFRLHNVIYIINTASSRLVDG
jgi:hypothetical protein